MQPLMFVIRTTSSFVPKILGVCPRCKLPFFTHEAAGVTHIHIWSEEGTFYCSPAHGAVFSSADPSYLFRADHITGLNGGIFCTRSFDELPLLTHSLIHS